MLIAALGLEMFCKTEKKKKKKKKATNENARYMCSSPKNSNQ